MLTTIPPVKRLVSPFNNSYTESVRVRDIDLTAYVQHTIINKAITKLEA